MNWLGYTLRRTDDKIVKQALQQTLTRLNFQRKKMTKEHHRKEILSKKCGQQVLSIDEDSSTRQINGTMGTKVK